MQNWASIESLVTQPSSQNLEHSDSTYHTFSIDKTCSLPLSLCSLNLLKSVPFCKNLHKSYTRPTFKLQPLLVLRKLLNFPFSSLSSPNKQKLQNCAARIISFSNYDSNTDELFRDLNWSKLNHQRAVSRAIMMYNTINNQTPGYLTGLFKFSVYSAS